MNTDEYYMCIALDEARKAYEEGEIPVGCVIVQDGHILSRTHNATETLYDATAHAEMQALTMASGALQSKYLDKATIYVTLEPCVMCAGAIGHTHIGRLVYGTDDPKKGYTRFTTEGVLHPKCVVVRGVLAEQCSKLLTDFFEVKR